MKLYLDLDSGGQFVSDPLFKAPVESVSFKRGDAASIELAFVKGNTVTGLASGASIAFGIKESGKYDGDFLVFTDEFTSLGYTYSIGPSFNTEALNEALNQDGNDSNDVASLNAMLEVSWSEQSGIWQSSRTITATILNDVIKGGEGTPTSMPDAEDWLADRAVIFTDEQALTDPQRLQARDNVGITLAPGGGGPADSGRVPTFGEYGDLNASLSVSIKNVLTDEVSTFNPAGLFIQKDGYSSDFTFTTLTGYRTVTVPDMNGYVALGDFYANDAAAASGGLSIGDLYFTGSKFRVRTT